MLRTLIAVITIAMATHASRAETYTVAPNAPGTIQALIDLVLVNGDVIQLEAGTYLLPDEIRITDLDITIRGVTDPKTGEPLSVLDGQGTHRICRTDDISTDTSTAFQSVVFTRGYATEGGAVQGDENTFVNCIFTGNTASLQGGGVEGYLGDFTDCLFQGNTAPFGGGASTCCGTFTNCTFTQNSANEGGGAYDGTSTFIGCTFSGNSATSNGGGLLAYNAYAVIDCAFTGNAAATGGAIWLYNGSYIDFTVDGCTITGNTASIAGGGLWLGALANTTITDSTICENSPQDIVGPQTDGGGNDTCGATPCPADLDDDGTVNSTEIGLVLALWGTGNPVADLDGDGLVGPADLGVILGAWGDCPE